MGVGSPSFCQYPCPDPVPTQVGPTLRNDNTPDAGTTLKGSTLENLDESKKGNALCMHGALQRSFRIACRFLRELTKGTGKVGEWGLG